MPHLRFDRPRLRALTGPPDPLPRRARWQIVGAVLYEIGGLVFMLGSIPSTAGASCPARGPGSSSGA
jgi:hypothetical protein